MGAFRNIGSQPLSVSIASNSYQVPPGEVMEIDAAYDYAVTNWIRQGVLFERVDADVRESEKKFGNRWNMIADALNTNLEELAESNPQHAEEIRAVTKPKPKTKGKRNAKQRPKD